MWVKSFGMHERHKYSLIYQYVFLLHLWLGRQDIVEMKTQMFAKESGELNHTVSIFFTLPNYSLLWKLHEISNLCFINLWELII